MDRLDKKKVIKITGAFALFIGMCFTLHYIRISDPDTKYCNIDTCEENHTMCSYSFFPQFSSKCGHCYQVGLYEYQKQRILELHNLMRQYVAEGKEERGLLGPQPAAVGPGIPPLQWNEELAKIAQRWASQCHTKPRFCHNTPEMIVHQLYSIKASSVPYATRPEFIVRNWYSSVALLNTKLVKNFSYIPYHNQKIYTYTQMIWAKTKYIGCGFVKCTNNSNTAHIGIFLCNYSPKGNNVGEPIYETA